MPVVTGRLASVVGYAIIWFPAVTAQRGQGKRGTYLSGVVFSVGMCLLLVGWGIYSLCVGYVKLRTKHGAGHKFVVYEDEPMKFILVVGSMFVFGLLAGLLAWYLFRNRDDLRRYE